MPAVSLYRRIGLAAVSGLLAYPLLRLDALFSASGNGTDSGWLMLHCAASTLLVLLPLVGGSARRLFRTVVLLGGTVVVYCVALLMPNRLSIDGLGRPAR